MKITDLHLTCVGYPTEWLAVDDTGRSVFIMYRYGELGVYPADDDGFDGFGPVLWSLKIGGEHDGEMTDEAMLEHLREVQLPPANGAVS